MRIKFIWFLFGVSLSMTFISPPSIHAQRGLSTGHPSPQAGVAGRFYALIIGNQAYTGLPRLQTAHADARAVDVLLREVYGFETKLLLDATRQQIVWAIHSYRQTLEPDANLLIYYAGHGIKDAEEEKAYWLPVDATRDDPSNWIIADEITTRIKVIPARHVIIVSDSCYSGTLTRGIVKDLPRPNERGQFLQRMMAGRSRTLMASGGDEPVADGGGGNHSVFANALLRGLREMDKDSFTASELFRLHVEASVAGRASQMPEYHALRSSGHESGDFVFVRVNTNGQRVEAKPAALPSVDESVLESEHWREIENSGDPEEYQTYLKKYPQGQFAATARQHATDEHKGSNNTHGGVAARATNKPVSNSAGGGRQSTLGDKSANIKSPSHQSGGGRERQSQGARGAGPRAASRGEPMRERRP